MNWDKLDIHVENLVPGLVMLYICAIKWSLIPTGFKDNEILIGLAFVAIAYMVGVNTNVVARLLLDTPSEYTIRPIMMKIFSRKKLPNVTKMTFEKINKEFNNYINAALTCGNDNIAKEVMKRRQAGRLIRSSLLPVCFLMYICSKPYCNIHLILFFLFCTYCTMLVVYAYSEVIIFHEAYHAVDGGKQRGKTTRKKTMKTTEKKTRKTR